jgi:RNA polymerase sigma factor (sigma-70 family)
LSKAPTSVVYRGIVQEVSVPLENVIDERLPQLAPSAPPRAESDAETAAVPQDRSTAGKLGPATRENIERLFKEHNESLLRFLRARLHSPQEARDIAQEAYVQVLGLRDPSVVSHLQAYLFQTAANLATNRLLQRRRRGEIDELVFFEEETAKSPEHHCAAQKDLDLIAKALEGMPAKVVRAFILVKFHEVDFEQTAKIMGCSSRNVRRYIARAMEHCMKAMHSHGSRQGGIE